MVVALTVRSDEPAVVTEPLREPAHCLLADAGSPAVAGTPIGDPRPVVADAGEAPFGSSWE